MFPFALSMDSSGKLLFVADGSTSDSSGTVSYTHLWALEHGMG